MSEVKTLKDFGKKGAIINGEQIIFYDNFELKQEAIKRYKKFFDRRIFADKNGHDEQAAYYQGRYEEIKEFYNLTEEELK